MIFYLCHQYACWNIKHQYREPLAISPSSAYNFCDVCFAQLDTYCNQIKIGKRCFINGKYIICYSIEITKWIIIYVVFLAKKIYIKKKDKFHWIFIIWWSVIFDETTLCLNQPYKFLHLIFHISRSNVLKHSKKEWDIRPKKTQ